MRRLVWVAIVGLLTIVGVVAYSFIHSPKTITLSQGYGAPPGFSNVVSYGNGNVVFTNGRSIASYNVHSGKTKLLSPDLAPSNLSDVTALYGSADQHYFVFREAAPLQGSILYQQLSRAGLDTTSSYWWLYNGINQSFHLLPTSVVLAKFSGNELYTLNSSNASDSLAAYDPADLKIESSTDVPDCSDFFSLPGGYLLQTTGNKAVFTTNGIVNQTLANSFSVVGVSSDGQTIVGVVPSGNNQNLVALNVKSLSTKTIDSDISGSVAWAPGGLMLYARNQGPADHSAISYYTYDLSTNRKVIWDISQLYSHSLTPSALIDTTTAIVSDPSGDNLLIGQSLAAVKLPPDTYRRTLAIGDQQVVVQASQSGVLLAPLTSDATAAKQKALYVQLQEEGYNPDLLSIIFPLLNADDD